MAKQADPWTAGGGTLAPWWESGGVPLETHSKPEGPSEVGSGRADPAGQACLHSSQQELPGARTPSLSAGALAQGQRGEGEAQGRREKGAGVCGVCAQPPRGASSLQCKGGSAASPETPTVVSRPWCCGAELGSQCAPPPPRFALQMGCQKRGSFHSVPSRVHRVSLFVPRMQWGAGPPHWAPGPFVTRPPCPPPWPDGHQLLAQQHWRGQELCPPRH